MQHGGCNNARLMLRGNPMPTDDYASATASGLEDGDVVQLVDDKTA